MPPKGQASSPTAARISGKPFQVESNSVGIQSLSFLFSGKACLFTAKAETGEYPIACGIEQWVEGETHMPGTPPSLISGSLGSKSKIAASGTWKDPQTFEMTWRFYETPHHDTVTCHFEGDRVKVEFMNSVPRNLPSHQETRPALQGRLTS